MARVEFSSSDTFLERDPEAVVEAEVEVEGYIEATYHTLRCGPSGEEIARLIDGAWQLADGRRCSDWAVRVGEGPSGR
jgi:hypothetical protein